MAHLEATGMSHGSLIGYEGTSHGHVEATGMSHDSHIGFGGTSHGTSGGNRDVPWQPHKAMEGYPMAPLEAAGMSHGSLIGYEGTSHGHVEATGMSHDSYGGTSQWCIWRQQGCPMVAS
ncbi:hypothetical protein BKA83DRAFT_4124358 [Pisolithus microcarpus]|nr:hypothetical protein BKA83DRAFT_4124358 [Pisolithus microcarpus]